MAKSSYVLGSLLKNLCDNTRTDGTSAFTNSEFQTFVHGNRRNQFDLDVDVVAGHNHLSAFREFHRLQSRLWFENKTAAGSH